MLFSARGALLVPLLKRRLSELGPPPYFGLTWRAGTAPEQQGAVWMLHKEIPLERFGAALRAVDGTLLALQRHPRAGEIEQLAALAEKPVHDLFRACDVHGRRISIV